MAPFIRTCQNWYIINRLHNNSITGACVGVFVPFVPLLVF
jgi:hypothetical protein